MVKNAQQLQKSGKTIDEVSTKIGKIIRPLHLDELPQLWNILKGDMSFVGYRPPIKKECNIKDETFKKVHSVRAGLTGLSTALAYIDNKNRDKILKDIHLLQKQLLTINKYYVENMNFVLDMKIIWWTILLEFEHFKESFKKIFINKD